MNPGILLAISSAIAYGAASPGSSAPSTRLSPCSSPPGVLGERIGTGQRTGIGICTVAVATLTLG